MTDETLAFVFPGQGSQRVGMLAELAASQPLVGRTFAEASAALGYDLWKLVQDGPRERLDMTEATQPALLTCSVALWRSWRTGGGAAPAVMAGHSLGEFSALVCAGALEFGDGVRLVERRGAFMQAAVPAGEGAMAAIVGLGDAETRRACEEAAASDGEAVAAVNFNSPGQVVIAGAAGLIDSVWNGAPCRCRSARHSTPSR